MSAKKKAIERCKELIKKEHECWIGITNQLVIKELLDKLEETEYLYNKALNDLVKAKKENKKKDKIIDLMGYAMTHEEVPINEYCVFRDISCEIVGGNKECKDCIKQYFKIKVEDNK